MRRMVAVLSWFLCTVSVNGAVAEPFPRSPELEPAIQFWTKIYGEVSTGGGLLHDRSDLSIIYETIRFPEGATHAQRVRHVRDRRAYYSRMLETLAAGDHRDLSAEERRVLRLWGIDADGGTLRRASRQIRFQRGQSDRFRRGLVRSGMWEEYIHRTLDEMGLPREIEALPHVESSFNPDAYSRAGAAGIWQFTRGTGRRFMRVDYVIDERMDPYLATEAAARLLRHNYSVTGDWALALSAYNHGVAGIQRAVKATGSRDITDIIREYEGRAWGFASRNFYPAFLAAIDVSAQAERYFGPVERARPVPSEVIEMPFYASINDIIDAFEVDRRDLRELNRGLLAPIWEGNKLVPRGYRLRVPGGSGRPDPRVLLARIGDDARYFAQIPDRYHTVARGDTLSSIALRYDVSSRELVSLNGLRNAHLIRVGQTLRLPVADGMPLADQTHYTVRRGDSLSRIAQRAGTSVSTLAAANGLDPERPIFPGQELRIDGRPAAGLDTTIAVAEGVGTTEKNGDGSTTVAAAADGTGGAADEADAVGEVQAASMFGRYEDWFELLIRYFGPPQPRVNVSAADGPSDVEEKKPQVAGDMDI